MANLTCPHCGANVLSEHLYCPNCTRSLRLVPPEPLEVASKPQTRRTVSWIVALGVIGVCALAAIPLLIVPGMVRSTAGSPPYSNPAQGTACMSNMKQLAVGALIYQDDYDDRNVPSASFQPMLMPYIKNSTVFYCPTTRGAYAANPDLLKVDSKTIKDPAKTVLFYEGMAKKLNATHGSTSNVAFADGHATGVVLPTGAKSLVWKP